MARTIHGALIRCNFGLTHPDTFHYIGFSASVFEAMPLLEYEARNGRYPAAQREKTQACPLLMLQKIRSSMQVVLTVALLRKHDIKVDLAESGGGHTWINWRRDSSGSGTPSIQMQRLTSGSNFLTGFSARCTNSLRRSEDKRVFGTIDFR